MRTCGPTSVSLLAARPPAAAQTRRSRWPSPAPGRARPATLMPAIVACTDLPATALPSSPLRILAPHGGDTHEFSLPRRHRRAQRRHAAGTGCRPALLRAALSHAAHRRGGLGQRPRRGADLGLADGDRGRRALRAGARRLRLRWQSGTGDYLEPFVEPVLPSTRAAGEPHRFQRTWARCSSGSIAGNRSAPAIFSRSIAATAKASASARASRSIAIVMNGTPLVEMGTGVVVEVSAETAKVVLDRARFPVTSGDYFGGQNSVACIDELA